jgi:hypothetical protein
MKIFAFGLLQLLAIASIIGCGESGNRIVETKGASIPSETAVESQKAAEADLPAP